MTSPDVDYAHTTGAERARLAKAAAIADTAALAGLSADDVAHLSDPQRKALVKIAGTRPASAETWRLVATLMARGGDHHHRQVPPPPPWIDVYG